MSKFLLSTVCLLVSYSLFLRDLKTDFKGEKFGEPKRKNCNYICINHLIYFIKLIKYPL